MQPRFFATLLAVSLLTPVFTSCSPTSVDGRYDSSHLDRETRGKRDVAHGIREAEINKLSSTNNNIVRNVEIPPQNGFVSQFQKQAGSGREMDNSDLKRTVTAIVKRQLTDGDFKSLYIQKLSDDIKQKLELSDAKNIPIQKLSEIVKRELETNFKNQYIAKLTDIVRSELEDDLKNLNSHPENAVVALPSSRDGKSKRKIKRHAEENQDVSNEGNYLLTSRDLAKKVKECFTTYMVDACLESFNQDKSMREDEAAESSPDAQAASDSSIRSKRSQQSDVRDLQENMNPKNLEESSNEETPARMDFDDSEEGFSDYDSFNEDGPAQLKIQIEYSSGSVDRNGTKDEPCLARSVEKSFTEANASKGAVKQRQVETLITCQDQLAPHPNSLDKNPNVRNLHPGLDNHGVMIKRQENKDNREAGKKISVEKKLKDEPVCALEENLNTEHTGKDLDSELEQCGITGEISNSALNLLLISVAEKYAKNNEVNPALLEECNEAIDDYSDTEVQYPTNNFISPHRRHLLSIDENDYDSDEDRCVPGLSQAKGIDWVKALQPHASIRKRDLSTDPLNSYNTQHSELDDEDGNGFCPASDAVNVDNLDKDGKKSSVLEEMDRAKLNNGDRVQIDVGKDQQINKQGKTASGNNVNKLNSEALQNVLDLHGQVLSGQDSLPTKVLKKRDLQEDLLNSFGGLSDSDEGKSGSVQKKVLDQTMDYFESDHDGGVEKRSVEDEETSEQLTEVELLLGDKKSSWADVSSQDECDNGPHFETSAGFSADGKYSSPILAGNIGNLKRRRRRSERVCSRPHRDKQGPDDLEREDDVLEVARKQWRDERFLTDSDIEDEIVEKEPMTDSAVQVGGTTLILLCLLFTTFFYQY